MMAYNVNNGKHYLALTWPVQNRVQLLSKTSIDSTWNPIISMTNSSKYGSAVSIQVINDNTHLFVADSTAFHEYKLFTTISPTKSPVPLPSNIDEGLDGGIIGGIISGAFILLLGGGFAFRKYYLGKDDIKYIPFVNEL